MSLTRSARLSVAPMMDWTDRHCRYFHRQMSRHALLYTEMVTAPAVINGDQDRLLGFSDAEHPVAVQLGGSDPAQLAQAAKICADFGYAEINLNCGCPSDRVQSGSFGAVLMENAPLVADCVAAMRAVVDVPVTVKCRIGVDDQDPNEALFTLVEKCKSAGVTHFIVHARKAWLEGLSPKENRDIPPLDYALVYQLKAAHPDLLISINGGIETLPEAQQHMAHVDGVMLGRAAYHNPVLLAEVDARFFGGEQRDLDAAVAQYCEHVERELGKGARLHTLIKPMLGLYNGRPGARLFRRHLSENAPSHDAGISVLRDALAFIGQRRAA